ncbi:glutathione S-transferase [Mycena crocata]|nr:glutathione S-transferase [Mycena crocata]
MVLKLYSAPYARGPAGLVMLVLAEKKIPYEHIAIDMANKEHKTPEHLAKHPFGLVPVIDDDGFILYESRAICRYLVEKYADQGPALVPTGLREKALFEQAASVELANFNPSIFKLLAEAFGKPRRGLPVDEVVIAEHMAELSAKLDVYENILGKQKYLAGEELTLADLFHLCYAPMVVDAGYDAFTTRGPNVAHWWNALVSRPEWVKLKAEGVKSTMN